MNSNIADAGAWPKLTEGVCRLLRSHPTKPHSLAVRAAGGLPRGPGVDAYQPFNQRRQHDGTGRAGSRRDTRPDDVPRGRPLVNNGTVSLNAWDVLGRRVHLHAVNLAAGHSFTLFVAVTVPSKTKLRDRSDRRGQRAGRGRSPEWNCKNRPARRPWCPGGPGYPLPGAGCRTASPFTF